MKDLRPQRSIEIRISFPTIIKLLFSALLVFILGKLAPILVTLFLAIMVAVTLYPAILKLEQKRVPRWASVSLVAISMILFATLVLFMILPPLVEQSTQMVQKFPELKKTLFDSLPATGPIHATLQNASQGLEKFDATKLAEPLMAAGQIAIGGFTELFLIFIFTIYLLTDGPRATEWFFDFFAPKTRRKLEQTGIETSKVISAYVAGQVITSLICGIYTFAVLSALHVPAALTLATIAGIFDVLPVLGFFLAAAPAVILGLTISPLTAALVAALYVLYHAIENYILVPKIYGNRLRLTDLVVLVSLLAAGAVGGIVGAIVILPLVASYPIIERIWLVDYFGREVIAKHAEDESETASQATRLEQEHGAKT